MSDTLLQNDETHPEIDGLLRDYFRAETPKPWPAFKAPKPVRAFRQTTSFSRYAGRLALAACVALLVAGYLTLAGYFPGPSQSQRLDEVVNPIGLKGGGKKIAKPNEEKAPDAPQPMP